MRIAIFSDTLFPQINGVAYGVFHSAKFLSKQGHEVIVVTALSEKNKVILEKRLKNEKVEVIFSPSVPLGFYPGERLAIPLDPTVLKKLKHFKPEIIHSHTPFSVGLSAVMASKKLKVPLMGTHHTFYDHYLKYVGLDYQFGKNISWKYTVWYYNFCDLILCPSFSLADELIKNGLKKPTRIFANGIDTNFFVPTTLEEKKRLKHKLGLSDFSLVYVGRLGYEKSVDVVLKTLALVHRTNPEIKLLVGGDGPEREELEHLAEKLGIRKNVLFTGFLRGEKWLEAYQSADVFITASKSENMPLTILEAMSAGLPIVAVAEKGIVEIVNEDNGFLSRADDAEDLAQNILKLEKDLALRGRMNETSRPTALDYSYDKVGRELAQIYLELIQKKLKVCLYLEYLHFRNGALFKNIGTGLLSSYKNQKIMLERMGVEFVERWEDNCSLLQINTPWLKSLYLMKKAKNLGKLVIIWAHVTAEDIKGVFRFSSIFSPIMKIYLKYAYNQADLIFCPSEYTRGLITNYGISPKKVIAQSNGVDLKKFYPNEEKREAGRKYFGASPRVGGVKDVVIGTVALAIPRKGIKTFITLAQKFSNHSFLWFGKIYSGALVEKLPQNLPENVRFTGFVPDILEAFSTLDIFVFLSYEENQGMVILEAAALGLPILVRDIPVYNGWLVDGENCLKAKTDLEFEQKLKWLVENKGLREKLRTGALKLAQKESLDTLSKKLLPIYQGVL